jgi:hypothetical protein
MLVGPPNGERSDTGVWDEIPFHVEGWRAFWIDGIDGDLTDWVVSRATQLPAEAPGILGSALLVEGPWLYVWSLDGKVALLARFDRDALATGDLSRPQWWDGDGWSVDASTAAAAVDPAMSEFSVHRWGDRYLLVDVHSFGVPETGVQLRWADRPEGPWSERTEVFRIPEAARDGVIAYAGKGHPELGGPGLLVTYATNTGGLDDVIWNDESLYYPRFVRVDI